MHVLLLNQALSHDEKLGDEDSSQKDKDKAEEVFKFQFSFASVSIFDAEFLPFVFLDKREET